MPTPKNLVPETTHFAVRDTTVAELQRQANASAQTDPVKSDLLNSIIKSVGTRPGFGNKAISVSAHFGLHKMPADTHGVSNPV